MDIADDIRRRIHYFTRKNQKMPTLLLLGPDVRDALIMGLRGDGRYMYQWVTAERPESFMGLEIMQVYKLGVCTLAIGE